MLAVGGMLDKEPGGEHPFPPESEWQHTQHRPFVAVYETNKRSVYLMQQRIRKQPYLAIFERRRHQRHHRRPVAPAPRRCSRCSS